MNHSISESSIQGAHQSVCRALALSGGANNGAWEAGVLWGFANYGVESDFSYDVVTGVSAGSLNTMGMAGWDPSDAKGIADFISDLWMGLATSDVWQDWSLGRASGFLFMGGVVDNSPLQVTVRQIMSPFSKYLRRVTISTTNVNTGEYTNFDQTNTNIHDLWQAAISSSSIPFVFPPHVWQGRGVFMDGGTVYNIDIESAIHQCLDLVGGDESKIVVDALFCGAPDEPAAMEKTGNTAENYLRATSLGFYYANTNSIAATMAAHPKVQMRHVITQEHGTMGFDMMNFDGEFTWPLQEKGRNNAKDVLSGNNGKSDVGDFFREWLGSESLRETYSQVGDYLLAMKEIK